MGELQTAPRISTTRAVIELILAVSLWGGSFSFMKTAVTEIPTPLVVLLRQLSSLPILAIAAHLRGELRLPTKREALILAGMGLMGFTFHNSIQFYAMRDAGAANANWIIAATPSITAVASWIFLGERLRIGQIAGLAVSVSGVLLVVGLGTKGMGMLAVSSFGDVLMMISAFNWSAFQILSRKFVKNNMPTFTVFWMFAFAAMMQCPIVALSGTDLSVLADVSTTAWLSIAYLGVLASGVCYTFWYDGLATMPTARVAAFQFIQPICGVAAAYFINGERFTIYIAVGGAMTLFGVWLVNRKGDAKNG